MAARMEATEMRQHNMMAFLAKAVNNPAFLQQLLGSHAHPGTGAGQRITDAKGARTGACCALLPARWATSSLSGLTALEQYLVDGQCAARPCSCSL